MMATVIDGSRYHRTVENNAYVCRIEIFPPKVNVKIQVSYTYDKLSIYIGHFML